MKLAGQWCLAQCPGSDRWRTIKKLGKKNGRIVFVRMKETDYIQKQCKGKVSLSFSASQLFILQQQFPILKPGILELQIQQDFNNQGLAPEDESFLHRQRIMSSSGDQEYYISAFVPKTEAYSLYRMAAKWRGIRQLNLYPDAVAIAGLFRAITSDTVLVLLLDSEKYQLVAVKDGFPLYNQRLTPDENGNFDINIIPHALDFAAQTINREHDIKKFSFICLGPEREIFDPKSVPDLDVLDPDFSSIILTDNPDDILSYPQLFGTSFADKDYNFTPLEFSRSWKLQQFGVAVSVLSCMLATGLFFGWFLLQDDLEQLRSQYQQLHRTVSDQRFSLTSILPEDQEMSIFDRLVSIRTSAASELRLDDIVRKIALSLDLQVHINELTVDRKKADQSPAIAAPPDTENLPDTGIPIPGGDPSSEIYISPQEEMQKNILQVHLRCQTSGTYDDSERRIRKSIFELSQKFNMNDVFWNYDEREGLGYLSCMLLAKNEKVEKK